jgi:hypothetical protein
LPLILVAANGQATTVSLLRDGVPVERGEVCRFAAGDRDNPFHRWLRSQDVTCTGTHAPISFPRGLWNVFGRVEGAALSSAPVLVDGEAAPETLSLSLDPAAEVLPILPTGTRGVVYAPRRGSAFPIAEGSRRVTIPAGENLWLFTLEKSAPIAVVPIAPLEAASERTVDARTGGPSSVIGWLQMPEPDHAAQRTARGVPPPHVRAGSKESDPLPPLESLHGAFVRVRDVSAGDTDLELGGRGWLPHRRRVRVSSAVSLAPDPLIARAAATVAVNWSTDDDLPALDRSIGSCQEAEKPPQFEISLAACAPPPTPAEPPDAASCAVIRQESFPPHTTFGVMTVEDVVPGFYRAEMRFGKLPPVSTIGSAPPLQQRSLRLFASYIELYGSVTRGGDPLDKDTLIEFPADGVGFATRDTSEYRAVLPRLIGIDAPIIVKTCDGSLRALVLADRPARRSARFDIDIPDNELTITVSDTFTQMPLKGSTVRYVVMSTRVPRRPVVTQVLTTSDDESEQSRLVIAHLPEREIRLTVSHPGYQKRDVEPFSMARSERKSIDVQLVPLRGTRGKIVSPRPFESGAIFWFSPAGTETEHAELAPDGTFVYAGSHDASETMTVVSQSHPLWISRAPAIDRRETFEVRFPDAASREFDVAVEGADRRDARFIGVAIGGLRVPQPALQHHQALRRLAATVRGPGPLRVRDIAETGPIDVILGPTAVEVSSRALAMDVFALPQFANAPHKPLAAGATAIVFTIDR